MPSNKAMLGTDMFCTLPHFFKDVYSFAKMVTNKDSLVFYQAGSYSINYLQITKCIHGKYNCTMGVCLLPYVLFAPT